MRRKTWRSFFFCIKPTPNKLVGQDDEFAAIPSTQIFPNQRCQDNEGNAQALTGTESSNRADTAPADKNLQDIHTSFRPGPPDSEDEKNLS